MARKVAEEMGFKKKKKTEKGREGKGGGKSKWRR